MGHGGVVNFTALFDKMMANLSRDHKIASSLATCNEEDDIFSKIAVVAFTYNANQDEWSYANYCEVRSMLDDDIYADNVNDLRHNHALAFCYLVGYVIGLRSSGKISRTEFEQSIAIVHGYIFCEYQKIDAMEI